MTSLLPPPTVLASAPGASSPTAGARFRPRFPEPRPGHGGPPVSSGPLSARPARATERDGGRPAVGWSEPPWRLAAWVAAADVPRLAAVLGPRVVVVPCATVGALEAALTPGDCRAAVVAAAVIPAPDAPRLAGLVRRQPHVLTAGLVGEAEGFASRSRLRDAGVLALFDADRAVGWHALGRSLAPAHLDDALQRRCVAAVASALWGAHRTHGPATLGLSHFFAAVFARDVASARDVAARLSVPAPTLHARFYRRELPSAKRYVEAARLVRAASLAEAPGASVRAVALTLDASSPQSLHRAVRRLTGLSASEFLRQATAAAVLEYILATLVRPYQDTLRAFDPTRRGVA